MTIAEQITALMTQLDAFGDAILAKVADRPYDMHFFSRGVPEAGALMTRVNSVRLTVLPQNLTGSRATAEVPATAQTVLNIRKWNATDGFTTIGTITFAAGAKVGTFTFAAEVNLTTADIVYVYNAATSDATLADISVGLVGKR